MKVHQIGVLIEVAWNSDIIKALVVMVVMDTVFGLMRAVKERKFNSCFGIDGAIRKISMLVSIAFLLILDQIINFNMIGFVHEDIRKYIMGGKLGSAEFFGLLYAAYEAISILKNMTLCGLPLRKVWEATNLWLRKYTNELPAMETKREPERKDLTYEETEPEEAHDK